LRRPAQARLPKRQAVLILLILAVPCLVLTGLGLQVDQQERQLAARRAEEERQRLATQFRSEFLAALERLKYQAVAGRGSAALVADVREGKPTLPFQDKRRAERFRSSLATAFGERTAQAEKEEFGAHRLDRALELYRVAIAESRQPWERAYAGLLLARVMQKAGRTGEALRQYEATLKCPVDVTDEYGVPFVLYAANPIVEADRGNEVLPVISAMIRDPAGLGPQALYKTREVAVKLQATGLIAESDRLIQNREQAESMQADYPRLISRLESDDPVWLAWGRPVWLISLARGDSGRSLVALTLTQCATVADKLGKGVRITQGKEGESLGDAFPGLGAVFPPLPVQSNGLGRMFLALTLGLVMALTLFAGYLLWRDVRLNAQLSELRSQFVSSVSHELRTPLTSIRMFTESMRMDDEMDAETRAEYLDTVLHECERLSRLVDNVLSFARIEQGRAAYSLRPLCLRDLVEHAVRTFNGPAEQAGFRVEVSIGVGLPDVLADQDALEQALLNLLGNAMKYSGTSRDIALRVERDDGLAAIGVEDHGIGIAPEEQAHIFERFYRAATPENREIPGAGLGLALVDHIMKAHRGSVSVRSRPGEGATFTIRIPFVTQAAERVAATSEHS
jgi:signal transduction histidine kinase